MSQSSDLMMNTTEADEIVEKTQEKILAMQLEAEEVLVNRKEEIREILLDMETETEIKQESLAQLITLEAHYLGKLGDLRIYVDAIETLFAEKIA